MMITLTDARWGLAAAEQKAQELGQPMNIAVVDAGGNLVAHVRMDGAWIDGRARSGRCGGRGGRLLTSPAGHGDRGSRQRRQRSPTGRLSPIV
jgi:hypothetical protein